MGRDITVRAGDFVAGSAAEIHYKFFGNKPLAIELKVAGRLFRESIPIHDLVRVEIVAQDSVSRSGNTILRGVVGQAIFGPVGAIVGAMSSSDRRQTEVMFCAEFKDGRTLLASSDFESFSCLKSAVFAKDQSDRGASLTKSQQEVSIRSQNAAEAEISDPEKIGVSAATEAPPQEKQSEGFLRLQAAMDRAIAEKPPAMAQG